MNHRDVRSVSELLLEGDLTSRRMLMDAEQFDAAALAAAWSGLLQAAEDFVSVLPRRGAGPEIVLPSTARDPSLGRLRAVTDRLEGLRQNHHWLASAPANGELMTVVGNLIRARDLVVAHHRAQPVPPEDVLRDGAAARARVIHTLWVSAHAMSLAARHASQAQTAGSRGRPAWREREASAPSAVMKIADSLEQLAGEEVRRTFPTALTGEWREVPETSRLRESLAAWEIEARRVLAGNPTAADRSEVLRIQGAILAMGRVLLGVAAHGGVVDSGGFQDEVAPRLLEVEARIGCVQNLFRDLAFRGAGPLDERLSASGSEVVLAHTELILDGSSVASPSVIARRTDLKVTARDVLGALPAAVGVLNQLGTSLSEPDLVLQAIGVQQLINRLEARKGLQHESPAVPWISPRDIALGRPVKPPDWIRAELDGAVAAASSAVSDALTASTQAGFISKRLDEKLRGEADVGARRPSPQKSLKQIRSAPGR